VAAIYAPPDPSLAEQVYRDQAASDAQRARLDHAPTEEVRRVARDPAEPLEARSNAMLVLLIRRDPSVSQIFPEMFEHPKLCHLAIRYCPLSDPKIVERLHALLDHPRDRIWSAAAFALSRNKDETIRPRLLEWLNHGDHGHRSVAIAGLVELDRDHSLEVLRGRWMEKQDAEDRNVLAAALLRLGDTRGPGFLDAEARKAEGAWSVHAAVCISGHEPVAGLHLMLNILDNGDREALSSLVWHGWNMAHLPHAFTADAIHETRAWLEQRLQAALQGTPNIVDE
jgi:HEAT repeats